MFDEFAKVLVHDQLGGKFQHSPDCGVCHCGVPFFVEDNHAVCNGIQDGLVASRFDAFAVQRFGERLRAFHNDPVKIHIDGAQFCEGRLQTARGKP